MEIDITEFFQTAAPRDYSASAAELGQNAGAITWGHAVEDSEDYMLLQTEDQRQAFRDHVSGCGAWDDDEINAWSDIELNALLIQFIAGDIREADLDTENPNWDEYQKGAEAGQYSGNLFLGIDGRIYYYVGR
jgi:hypothetical protein